MSLLLASLAVVDGQGVFEALLQLHQLYLITRKTLSLWPELIMHHFINVVPRDFLQIRGGQLQRNRNSHPQECAEQQSGTPPHHPIQGTYSQSQVKTNLKDSVNVRPGYGLIPASVSKDTAHIQVKFTGG